MKTGEWIKASKSSTNGSCVEIMYTGTEYVVRDSKDREGPVLTYTLAEWDAFIEGAKDGEFDI